MAGGLRKRRKGRKLRVEEGECGLVIAQTLPHGTQRARIEYNKRP